MTLCSSSGRLAMSDLKYGSPRLSGRYAVAASTDTPPSRNILNLQPPKT